MPKVVGVKFKKSSRVYYFEAGEFQFEDGIPVIVETARGTEMGYISMLPTEMEDDKIVAPLKPIVRLATKKDVEQIEKLEAKRLEALKISAQKIAESNLDMKLTDCEYTFDGSKLIIYFTADGRVDFRDLVKDLASAFHVRIELRQIGARDECKMLGGLGPCGRPCCCSNHMPDYAHVTIKMAKNQGLSLNPTKISGLCGRLMCCLSYENEVYTEANKILPSIGEYIKASDNREGVVVALNHLKESVRIKIQDGDKVTFADVHLKDIGAENEKTLTNRHEEEEVPEIFEENTEFVEDEKPVLVKPQEKSENEDKGEQKKDKNRFKKKNKNKQNNPNSAPQNNPSQQKNQKENENRDEKKDNQKNRPHNHHSKPNHPPKPDASQNENNNGNNEQGENKNKHFHKKKKRFHKNNKGGAQGDGANSQN